MSSRKIKTHQSHWQPAKTAAKSQKDHLTLGQSLPTASEIQQAFANLPSDAMMGNVQTGSLDLPLQAKLQLGAVGDKYEQEADRIAKQVVNQIHSSTDAIAPTDNAGDNSLQRQIFSHVTPVASTAPKGEPNLEIQQKIWRQVATSNTVDGGTLSGDFEQNLNSAKSGGQPLDANLQKQMGGAMGADFSGVKIHTDARSDRLSRSIQARAFTTGRDVFFKQGEYNPNSTSGRELIAHELTHVVQQNQGVARSAIVQRTRWAMSLAYGNGTKQWKTEKANLDPSDKFYEVIAKTTEIGEFLLKVMDDGYDPDYHTKYLSTSEICIEYLNRLEDLKSTIEACIKQWENTDEEGARRIAKMQDWAIPFQIEIDIVRERLGAIEGAKSLKEERQHTQQYNPDLTWGIAPPETQLYTFQEEKAPDPNDPLIPTLGTPISGNQNKERVIKYVRPFDRRATPDPENEKYCIVAIGGRECAVEYQAVDFKPARGFQQIPDREGQLGYVPLFPSEGISLTDVKQTTLGDCYLQAALANIADRQPNRILDMMEENNDGTVTVTLYEVDTSDPENPQFTPKPIKVQRSLPLDSDGTQAYNRGALWVLMIQKAYALAGFGSNKTPKPSYQNISSGVPNTAFQHLLGEKALSSWLIDHKSTKTFIEAGVPWSQSVIQEYESVKAATPDDYSNLTLLTEIFGDDRSKIDGWMSYVQSANIEEQIKQMLDLELTPQQKFDKQNKGGAVVTLSDIETLFVGQSFTGEIMRWIASKNIFPGELGTAIYSQKQLEDFAAIKVALSTGKPIALTTKGKLVSDEQTEGRGASGGEQKYKGIAGGHAYAVLACKTTASPNPKDTNEGPYHWIQVFNPWGKYSREYYNDENGLQARGHEGRGDEGISWIELSDLTKYFLGLAIGQETAPVAGGNP